MLHVSEGIRVTSKGLDFSIEKAQKVGDHFLAKKENIGTDRWVIKGYYPKVSGLLSCLSRCNDELDEKTLNVINDLKEKIDSLIEGLKKYCVSDDDYYKITIDEDWSAVGRKMNFVVTKRSTIGFHHFVKEENIGKDKFTTYGFFSQPNLILRAVMNEKLLDIAMSEDVFPIEHMNIIVDEFVKNLDNITIEKVDAVDEIEEDDSNDFLDDEQVV